MSKERRTVSLDPEVDEYLDREGVNASELVNHLVKSHFTAGGDEQAMLKLREQQLKSELADLNSRAETKEQELKTVQDQLAEHEEHAEDIIEDAAEALGSHQLNPDNPAVENWASKAGVTEETLIERIRKTGG